MKNKVTLELNEMGNADVHFISLVDRGANRIPFRILKAEEGQMINLTTLFTKKKEEVPVHEVSGIAISKGSDIEAMTAEITQKGFTVHQVIDQLDNDLFVVKADADWTVEHQVVKMSDDVAVLVQTQKGFCSYPESNSFAENIQASGFYPGMSSALNTLGDTVYNIMCSADAPPVEDVRKACADFTEYLVGMAQSVPVSAFKFERIEKATQPNSKKCPECGATCATDATECKSCKTKIKKEEEPAAAEVTKTDEESAGEASTETTTETTETTTEASGAEGDTTTTTEEETTTENPTAEPTISEMIEAGLAKISTGLQEMFTTQLQGAVAKIDNVATEVQSLSDRIIKTEESLNGTVIGGTNSDTTNAVNTQKKEGHTSVFDTAFKFPGLED